MSFCVSSLVPTLLFPLREDGQRPGACCGHRCIWDSPVQMTCPYCHQTVVTQVDFSSGVLTYLFCGGIFFCGFVLGCCLIPFCLDRLKDAKHTCPSCKNILGVYKRL
nr:lipopolysaccharide-induced tumor necrosis factor-alpha factor homolog [Salvelinus alpinus]